MNEKDIRALAETARVRLEDEEIQGMAAYFSEAIPFCGAISKAALQGRLNLEGVPSYAAEWEEIFPPREDAVLESSIREEALAAAPETRDGFFLVPRILEEE